MTGLNPDPFVVALVQAAGSLPICVFAIPAGALADIFDKRRYLIVVELLYTTLAAAYAAMVWVGLATPINLLFFTFLLNAAGALTAPAWQAVVPQLVPKQDLSAAIAANSVGVNISRAVGPALGGAMISTLGIVAPFWVNAVSNLGVVGALVWWRESIVQARSCRPSASVRQCLPASGMLVIISNSVVRSYGQAASSYSLALIGRCYRSWLATKLSAVPASTVCFLAPLVLALSAARSCCPG
jgi:MFS family permease